MSRLTPERLDGIRASTSPYLKCYDGGRCKADLTIEDLVAEIDALRREAFDSGNAYAELLDANARLAARVRELETMLLEPTENMIGAALSVLEDVDDVPWTLAKTHREDLMVTADLLRAAGRAALGPTRRDA